MKVAGCKTTAFSLQAPLCIIQVPDSSPRCVFIFRAVNGFGKSTTVVKTIKYVTEITPPTLTVDYVPKSVRKTVIIISGTVQDSLDAGAEVYVNDKKVATGKALGLRWSL